jgi:hypothetical protein
LLYQLSYRGIIQTNASVGFEPTCRVFDPSLTDFTLIQGLEELALPICLN